MKNRILISSISITYWFLMTLAVDVYANGVPTPDPRRGPYEAVFLISILFTIAVVIEYYTFTYKKLDLISRKRDYFYSFLKINLITFPLTQILAYIIFIYLRSYYWYYIFAIEILVILAEWRLILIEFKNKHQHALDSRKVLKISILANTISFLLGFLPYTFFIIAAIFGYY